MKVIPTNHPFWSLSSLQHLASSDRPLQDEVGIAQACAIISSWQENIEHRKKILIGCVQTCQQTNQIKN